ncbi:MSF1 domain-containing protein [Paracoccidioides lutzii Pb01]|uniref:MSF1 domain-containing protein n=1 Tax=Paracoccidioides lutzii (strain ATCC MYA-826 / Pb01) TaxID=502779 RepID=C1GX14_PARBA|nr:MSF1 domain-containing protein [Paracoccidioides lutzii Pb01]EEH41102.1 MSF1 domain-containing protein [Paracoccidioides lutzii Pb01]
MKVFQSSFNYDYSFPAVCLAFFLRYPNPYSGHVLTTDVIDRYVDPVTERLHTTRLLLKGSRAPFAVLKLFSKLTDGIENSNQSFILETTVVDPKEGWMRSESRNVEWTGILTIVEKQLYRSLPSASDERDPPKPRTWLSGTSTPIDDPMDERTSVKTTVTFNSSLGQGMLNPTQPTDDAGNPIYSEEEAHTKRGMLAAWSTARIQRTIELMGVKRTRDAVFRSKLGMNVVLERLRSGGIVGVLEGMRRDREAGHEVPWKRVWMHGTHGQEQSQSHTNGEEDG